MAIAIRRLVRDAALFLCLFLFFSFVFSQFDHVTMPLQTFGLNDEGWQVTLVSAATAILTVYFLHRGEARRRRD